MSVLFVTNTTSLSWSWKARSYPVFVNGILDCIVRSSFSAVHMTDHNLNSSGQRAAIVSVGGGTICVVGIHIVAGKMCFESLLCWSHKILFRPQADLILSLYSVIVHRGQGQVQNVHDGKFVVVVAPLTILHRAFPIFLLFFMWF